MANEPNSPTSTNPAGAPRPGRPFVGPRTFNEREANRFFGRDREARDLLALVVRERLVLFYSQSGAGKSSLINAKLIPDLRAQSFEVLPVARVAGVTPPNVTPESIANIFAYNLILSINQGMPSENRAQADTLTQTSLIAYLGGDDLAPAQSDGYEEGQTPPPADVTADTDDLAPTVLIIDQFEEFVTTNLERWKEREGFFRQLRDALERLPNLWIVLTLREDYVARLEPYAELTPNRLRARFYMERMGIEAAQEAVKRPAELYGHPFAPGVAETLVDNLRRIRVQFQDEPHLGQYVEPVQLQVVCFQLWEKLNGPEGRWRTDTSAASSMITEADLPLDYIDQALTRFYEDAVADVLQNTDVRATQVTERNLREWFSKQLITEAGIRNTLLRNEETKRTGGLPNIAVDRLARHFLVRTELRAGGAWVELVHDRFVEPILDANRDWYTQQSPLLRAAQAWQDGGKQPAQLLLGPQLAAMGTSLDSPQEPLVAEFVAASRAAAEAEAERAAAEQRAKDLELARTRAQEQTDTANRLRQRLALLIVMGALAVVAAIVAGLAGYSATQQRGVADAAKVAALATGTAISHNFATADALRSTSDALRFQSGALLQTSEAIRLTSDASALEASKARGQAQALADSLIVLLTAQAPTPTPLLAPTETPTAPEPEPNPPPFGTPLATPPLMTPTPLGAPLATPPPATTPLATTPPELPIEPPLASDGGDTPVTSSGYEDLSPTPTMTPPPNLTADAALAALQEQLAYVEATRTAEKQGYESTPTPETQIAEPTPTPTAETQVTGAIDAILPINARYSLHDIVNLTMPAEARSVPGEAGSTDANVAGVFQPGFGLTVLAGQVVDGATWWRLAGVTPDKGVISAWVPDLAVDGTPLVQFAPKLPETDIPNPATNTFLRPPFDGEYPIIQLFGENAPFLPQPQTGVPLKGNPHLDFDLPQDTPVFAVDAGVVSAIGTDPTGAGDFVTIDHSWGQSTYTNMSIINVTVGEQVDTTKSIGTSGLQGLRTSPYLGIGIRINPISTDNGWDGYTDPLPYLPPSSYILPAYITQAGQP